MSISDQPVVKSSMYRLSVIVAEEMAVKNLAEIFEVLNPKSHPEIEFLLCTGSDKKGLLAVPNLPNVRVIAAPYGTRIPLLWRDGIRAAEADRVALTTAHCVPSSDWLERILAYSLDDNCVAVGGAIENAANDSNVGAMVYLLRYVRFTAAKASALVDDIAADNAVYRKADIVEHSDLLDIGFWEPSFHQRFIAEGKQLRFDNQLVVVHKNCYTARQFIGQRFSHGIEFGMARGIAMSVARRLMMILLSPLIPVVFIRKIVRSARSDPQFNFAMNRALMWLLVFVLAWSLGETIGYIKALLNRSR